MLSSTIPLCTFVIMLMYLVLCLLEYQNGLTAAAEPGDKLLAVITHGALMKYTPSHPRCWRILY
jgi:hypothetical protein